MKLGMIGLGRMGLNMSRRLIERGHEIVAFDVSDGAIVAAGEAGAEGADSLEGLVKLLEPLRAVWVMVPHGDPTRETITGLADLLEAGDVIVDGGNSRYTDGLGHHEMLADRGISFIDAGVSGGVHGLEDGYCLMIGSEPEPFARLEPIFADLAPADGYAHVGPPGSGHFVKMVHNGIEYAMLQAYGEGFELMAGADDFPLDLRQIAEVWRHGSVVRSWLLDLLVDAFDEDPGLERIGDWVDDSGEGRWAVEEAVRRAVPASTLAVSLFARFSSRQEEDFSAKVIAALRKQFGGHAVREERD